jgi:hypothetical protein
MVDRENLYKHRPNIRKTWAPYWPSKPLHTNKFGHPFIRKRRPTNSGVL